MWSTFHICNCFVDSPKYWQGQPSFNCLLKLNSLKMLIFYTVETQVRWLYGHMAIEFTLSDHLSVCLSLCLGRANAPVEYEKISNLLIWRNIINCHWNIIFCFSSLIFSIFFFIFSFYLFYPLSYGMYGPSSMEEGSLWRNIKWMESWDL